MKILESVPLSLYTSFRTGGRARYFAEVETLDELQGILERAEKENLPVQILGEGTNILVPDEDFSGYVLRVMFKGIGLSDDGLLVVGAGEHWDDVVAFSVSKNLSGIENLSWIPGSAGAAPVQNIGAYGSEIKDVLEWVEVFDSKNSEVRTISSAECEFGYRNSIFKGEAGRELIILRIAMRLLDNGKPNISYKDLQNYFLNDTDPTIADVREAVIKIRQAKLPDIAKVGTAGSFFKNPVISNEEYQSLAEKFPGLPAFRTDKSNDGGEMKIPLAWILDKVCNLNGFREGNVGLYKTQPLALVNFGGATSLEIKNFAQKISDIVFNKTGLKIEWEVNSI
jgi:UDP-N-acetylmuramate dehydrogenase